MLESLFSKVAKEILAQVFSYEFGEFLRDLFYRITPDDCFSLLFECLPLLYSNCKSLKIMDRCSRPEVCYETSVLKNVSRTAIKLLCRSLFDKVAGVRSSALLKRRLWLPQRCSFVNFCEIFNKRAPREGTSEGGKLVQNR